MQITRTTRDRVRLRRAGIVLASFQGRSAAEAAAMFAMMPQYAGEGSTHSTRRVRGIEPKMGWGPVEYLAVHKHIKISCADDFGPLNLQPRPGRGRFPTQRPERLRATFNRTGGVRHMFAALELSDTP